MFDWLLVIMNIVNTTAPKCADNDLDITTLPVHNWGSIEGNYYLVMIPLWFSLDFWYINKVILKVLISWDIPICY